ncbi:MAG TPA: hypothetical protein VIQ51_01135 [Chryseosolibacter sp.]
MNQRFNLLFYLKKPKKYEEGGLMPVYMRVSVAEKEQNLQRSAYGTQLNQALSKGY